MTRLKRETGEILMGALLVVVAGLFLFTSYAFRDVETQRGYTLYARFNKVDGLSPGDAVTIGGFTIGHVLEQKLSPDSYKAITVLNIGANYPIPVNSVATINGEGLIGGKYVKIEPGDSVEVLQPGDFLRETRDVIDMEGLIRDIINLAVGGSGDEEESEF